MANPDIFPGAEYRPLADGEPPAMTQWDIICLHTMWGYLWGTDSYFRQEGWSGTESHFGVGGPADGSDDDGRILQWVPCMVPGTRVLCADLVWRPVEQVCTGDELIGLDEAPTSWNESSCHLVPRRRLRRVVADNRGSREADLYVVRAGGKEMKCSAEHPWLARTAGRGLGRRNAWTWVRADELRPGYELFHVLEPWEVDNSRRGGWIAGLYDGEGALSVGTRGNGNGARWSILTCCQVEGPLADEMGTALKEFAEITGIYRNRQGRSIKQQPLVQFQINRVGEIMRMLGSVRPMRLLPKAASIWEGVSTQSMVTPVSIDSVEPCGRGEVITLSTSGRTYLAEGFAVHNCDRKADANLDGNWHIISIETSDGAKQVEWSPKQIEANAQICAWACKRYNIPAALIPDSKPGRRGIAYHRHGINNWRVEGGELWSNSTGKICPNDLRIAQVPAVIARTVELLGGAPPVATTPPSSSGGGSQAGTFTLGFDGGGSMSLRMIKPASPDMQGTDVKSWQRLLADRGYSPGAIDGYYGGQSETACRNFQKAKGLGVDGIIGAKTAERLLEG